MGRANAALLYFSLSAMTSASYALDAPTGETAPSFNVQLIVTAKGREVLAAWERPSAVPFQIEPVRVAPRGVFLSALVLFKGCRADDSGNCNAQMDVVALDPNGRVYGTMRATELWQGKPAPPPGYTQLSLRYMGVVIEPNDPSGKYRVIVQARDLNSASSATSETTFEVQ